MGLLTSKKKLTTISIIVILVIGATGLALYLALYNEDRSKTVANLCITRDEGSLLAEAESVFEGAVTQEKISEYRALADRAKSIAEFDQQPNCLYPVLYYQYLTRDITNAYVSLEQFEKIRAGKEFAEDIYGNFDASGIAGSIRTEKEVIDMTNFIGGSYAPYPPVEEGGQQ